MEIKIPKTVKYKEKTYKITSIGSSAFEYCSSLTSITIPDGVTHIGSSAFKYCSSLTNITIPDSITSIGGDTFLGCRGLQFNELDNAIYLGNSNNNYLVLISSKSTKITSCEINNSTKIIAYGAFDGCTKLTSIDIPDNVTIIEDYAFFNCDEVKCLMIGKSLTTIGYRAFASCNNLEQISVSENNINYKGAGNCLLTKDGKTLILGSLKSIIPNGVLKISDMAFMYYDITTLIIPTSVTNIGSEVFSYCRELTILNYAGTKTQWKSIIKGNKWNTDYNDATCNFTVICTDGKLDKNGKEITE